MILDVKKGLLHGDLGRGNYWGKGPKWEHAWCIQGTRKRPVWQEASKVGTMSGEKVMESQAMQTWGSQVWTFLGGYPRLPQGLYVTSSVRGKNDPNSPGCGKT